MILRWSWGGVGWDVNVHVALMMLRSEKKKSCRFWNNRPTGRYSNKCCLFIYFNTDILGLLAQKPSTTRIMGGDPKFKASFSCQLQKAYCYLCWWCSCMVQSCEGFESSLFSRESSAERICFHNSYSDQRIVEHQWNTDHWFRLEIVEMLASQESSKKKPKKKGTGDLATRSSKLEQRVWQWMWRRTKLRGNNSEKLAPMHEQIVQWLK